MPLEILTVTTSVRPALGWREWLALPALGLVAIKAKIDTGARSSALHVQSINTFHERGVLHVGFVVRMRRRSDQVMSCRAVVSDRRRVTDSGGHRHERWFINTDIILAGQRFNAEINLTDRESMLFPLLIGRTTLEGRFSVDPALSYTCGRPLSAVHAPAHD